MSLTLSMRRRRPTNWTSEDDAAALVVADVDSVLLQPGHVAAVIRETLRRLGGPGVRDELERRLDDAPVRTGRQLEWARDVLRSTGR